MFPSYLTSLETAALSDRLVILKKKWLEELSKRYSKIKSDKDKEIVWGLLENADPTKNKQYLQWILIKGISGWVNKTPSLFKEDIYKITENLELFDLAKKKNKLKVEHMDIGRLKSNEDLWILLQEYNSDEMKSNKDKKNEMEQSFYDKKAAILHVDTPSLKIVTPKTKQASCYFGVNTQWCTAAKQNNAFAHYNKGGSLYIILDKAGNKRWQFYLNTRLKKELHIEFMDEQDESTALSNLPVSIRTDTTVFVENIITAFLKDKKININKLDAYNFLEIIGNPVTQELYSALFNAYATTPITLKAIRLFGDNPEFFSKEPSSKRSIYKAVHNYINRHDSIEAYSKFIGMLPKSMQGIDVILPIPEGLTAEQEEELVNANPVMAFFLKNVSKDDKLKAIKTVNFNAAYRISDRLIESLNKDFFKDLNVSTLKVKDYFFNLAFHLADPDLLIKLMLNNEEHSFEIFDLLTSKIPIKSKIYKRRLEEFLSKHKENLSDYDKIHLVSQRGINKFTKELEQKNLLPKKLKSNKTIIEFSREFYEDFESLYKVASWFGGSKLGILREYSEWFEYAINKNSSKNNPMLYDVELFNGLLANNKITSYDWIELKKDHFNIMDTSNTKIVKQLTSVIERNLKDWLSDEYSRNELKATKDLLDNIRSNAKTAIIFKNTVRDLTINIETHTKYLEEDLETIRKQAKILGIGVNIEHKLKSPSYYDVTVKITEKAS